VEETARALGVHASSADQATHPVLFEFFATKIAGDGMLRHGSALNPFLLRSKSGCHAPSISSDLLYHLRTVEQPGIGRRTGL